MKPWGINVQMYCPSQVKAEKVSASLISWNSGTPHFIVLWFIALCRYCVFFKFKVCGNPTSSKSVGAIFPTAFVHFLSLSHCGNSWNFSNIFITIIFVMVICG